MALSAGCGSAGNHVALAISGNDAIHISMGMNMAPHTPEAPRLAFSLGVDLRHRLAPIAQGFSQFSQPREGGSIADSTAWLDSSFPLSTIAST